jgi:hypothetical protein
MAATNSYDLEKICNRIYSECDSLVTWNWDDRFQAVLSEFSADQEKEVITVLERHFDSCWDEETINYAPGKIRSVAKVLANYARDSGFFPVIRIRMHFCLEPSGPGGMAREYL